MCILWSAIISGKQHTANHFEAHYWTSKTLSFPFLLLGVYRKQITCIHKETWFLTFQDVIKVIGNCVATIIHIFLKPFLPDKPNIDLYADSIGLILKTFSQHFWVLTQISKPFDGVFSQNEQELLSLTIHCSTAQ